MTKYLIINADDFGMSKVFNETILDLIEKNQICAVSVMVEGFAENQKKQFDRLIALSKNKKLDVGLHITFNTNDYAHQIDSQFKKFKSIFGFNPSHADVHKAHKFMDSLPYTAEFFRKTGIPLRNEGVALGGVKSTPTKAFFGSVISFDEIETWIKTFKDGEYYEILFHPGKYDPDSKSKLNKERERDVKYIIELNSILKKNNIKSVSHLDIASANV